MANDGVWRTIGGRRVYIKTGQLLEDAMKESGKFNSFDDERQNKIGSVNIIFDQDNILPGLNKEDLEELGKEDKTVILKKSIIDLNLQKHPEVDPNNYNRIIGQALYNSDDRFGGKEYHNPDYINFIKYGDKYASLTLIELADKKDNYEIVHIFEPRNKKAIKMKPK